MAIKAGTTAMGSRIAKSELKASSVNFSKSIYIFFLIQIGILAFMESGARFARFLCRANASTKPC
jgi:hypothetical protein